MLLSFLFKPEMMNSLGYLFCDSGMVYSMY
jgi:hypothetical protein